ncbi:hypothetical protein Tco_1392993, partial [Tanacetum coccineum]
TYYSEQLTFNHTSYIEITSDSNIISYDQYMKEMGSAVVQNTTSTEHQNAMIMSVIDEISSQATKCNAKSLVNKNVNESLTAEHFGKHFVPQKELSVEQAFWLPISNLIFEQLVVPPTPVKTKVPRELPMVSLVKKSFQKLKSHLANFDKVVKVRTTSSALTEGTWGFEHTKDIFMTEVIPFLNSLRESFKDFDNGLHLELNEVKIVFNQMKAVVE